MMATRVQMNQQRSMRMTSSTTKSMPLNRCESVYVLTKRERRRHRCGNKHQNVGNFTGEEAAAKARTEGGPSWKHCVRAVNVKNGKPHYMVITEDYTQSDDGQTIQMDTLCYDVLQEPKQQQLQLEYSVGSRIRSTRLSICVANTRFSLIAKMSKSMGFQHVPEHRLWNIQWSDTTPHMDLFKAMKRFQQINHFPGMVEICRKDMLSRNLNRMLKLYPGDYRIFPKTWLLPTDTFEVAFYASRHKRSYILKPFSAGRGRGIWLTKDLSQVGKREKLICQTYIDKPLLIDGYKFDLRLYTLITSVDPLRIFVYNEGLARFATAKYVPPTLDNSKNLFMHLTNYSLNRHNDNYDEGSGDEGGSKRKLSAFNRWLLEHNYDKDEFWASVDDAIVKTVISAWPTLKHNYHMCFPKHDKVQACFQLLGFDILVDWKLKPYILEVNHTPSLNTHELVDGEVKRALVRDTLNMLSSVLVDKEQIIREDRAIMRDRLLRQSGLRRVTAVAAPLLDALPSKIPSSGELKQACSLGSLTQQIAWEESHLGNYRRIMPPTDSDKVAYYCQFYEQSGVKGPHATTTASRQRELYNRRQRLQQQNKLLPFWRPMNSTIRMKKLVKKVPSGSIIKDNHENLRAVIAKERQDLQKKVLLPPRPGTIEKIGIWQTLQKSPPPQQSKTIKQRYKRNTNNKNRPMPNKLRQQLILELDAASDELFLAEHAILQPAGTKLRHCSSSVLAPTNKHRFINKKRVSTTNTMSLPSIRRGWEPQQIQKEESSDHSMWRNQRGVKLENLRFKEKLFKQMYQKGHIAESDFEKFCLWLCKSRKNQKKKLNETPETEIII